MSEFTPEERAARRAELQAELAQLDEDPAHAQTPEPPSSATTTEPQEEDTTVPGFPTPGEPFDPTQEPPPDAAVGAGGPGWQPPAEDATTPPPMNTPTDPTDVATDAAGDLEEGASISSSSYDVVAEDGSTARITPGHSHVPCPVCDNTSLKVANVQSATPLATLKGETVNPGEQVVQCASCGNVIAAGDLDAFHTEAEQGYYGENIQAAAKGGELSAEDAAARDEQEAADLDAAEQQLADRRAALEQRRATEAGVEEVPATMEGGTHGIG